MLGNGQCANCQPPSRPAQKKRASIPFLGLQREHKSALEESNLLVATLWNIDLKRSQQNVRKLVRVLDRLDKLLIAHQTKEERLLLPIIQGQLDQSVIDSMTSEHQQLSDSLRKLAAFTDTLNASRGKSSIQVAMDSAVEFNSLIQAHFSREENVLFWFASILLLDLGESGLRQPL